MASRNGQQDMTPEQEADILKAVEGGAYPSQAAREFGFTPQALSVKKDRNPEFAELLAQAEARAENNLVRFLAKCAQKDWRATLATLERRWPTRWAKPEVILGAEKGKEAAASANVVEKWKEVRSLIPGMALAAPAHVADTPKPASGEQESEAAE